MIGCVWRPGLVAGALLLGVVLVAMAGCGPSVGRVSAPGGQGSPPEVSVERWTFRPDESFDRGPRDGAPGACGADVVGGIRALGLRGVSPDTTSCDVRTYGNGARRLRVVTVDYGEIQDCPSGCIQDRASMILRDGEVLPVDTQRVNLASPYHYLERFLVEALPARGVSIRDPGSNRAYRFLTETYDWCGNAYEGRLAIVTRGDEIWWSLPIPETVCTTRILGLDLSEPYDIVLSGEIVFPLAGHGPPDVGTEGLELRIIPRGGPSPATE